ncbi:hypothetical protein AXG93_4459s1000 [Marchantia polymorpha subsp. ruderalis]|uniref:Uncharacterized protein n=1 Tax=Marchantia polymorpha subsp. ruderalis TaxID=1480154 RepID=A0A176WAT3_MARPO|nr:hypothetical protein AXG93_4459s1000 [Marchantia polymorpha subsp. ruderalis]
MCVEYICPFHMVKGSGFKAYTQTILDIGVNFLRGLNVVELLHAPITVSHNNNNQAAQEHKTLSIEILKHVKTGIKMTSTTDIWTDDINKTSFVSLVVVLTVKKLVKIAHIDEELLLELITFLQSFEEAILTMEVFKQPMFQRMCYFRHSLLLHCDLITEDVYYTASDGINSKIAKDLEHILAIKPIIRHLIEEKFII